MHAGLSNHHAIEHSKNLVPAFTVAQMGEPIACVYGSHVLMTRGLQTCGNAKHPLLQTMNQTTAIQTMRRQ